MNVETAVRRLNNKVVSVNELNRYFGTKSVDGLLWKLQQLARDDYLKFEVSLDAEYFGWQKDHRNVIMSNDINNGTDLGYESLLKRDTNGLRINSSKPLKSEELVEVIQKLPTNLINQYMRFRLWDIDPDGVMKSIGERQKADSDEFYDRVEYNGLVVDGVEVTYDDKPISTAFQHRQALRLLIKKRGKLCFKDEFIDTDAGIFNEPPTDHALRNLIYEVRVALRTVTDRAYIKNTPKEGWSLKIEP